MDISADELREWIQILISTGLLLLTVVLACATIAYTSATRSMAEATHAQAAAAKHRPYVHLFFHWKADTVGLRNIGDRVAHEVKVEIHADFLREGGGFLAAARLLKEPIPSLAPGGEVKESCGNTAIKGSNHEKVDVTVSYRDSEGIEYSERAKIRLSDAAEWFAASPPVGPSREESSREAFRFTVGDSLEKAAGALSRLGRAAEAIADKVTGDERLR